MAWAGSGSRLEPEVGQWPAEACPSAMLGAGKTAACGARTERDRGSASPVPFRSCPQTTPARLCAGHQAQRL